MRLPLFLAGLLLGVIVTSGCSVRKFAISKMGDAIASGGTTFQSDEDLELIRAALPFSLKLMESLLVETPRHKGLLQATCLGFTSYSYLYVHQEADRLADVDLSAASRERARAQKLYQRGHGYCLRGLDVSYKGISDGLLRDPAKAVTVVRAQDVPLLYWAAASLGLGISVSRGDTAMLARLPEVDALLARALALDEDYDHGALHAFRVNFSSAVPGKANYDLIQTHFERAVELSKGNQASLYVAYAEAFAVPQQKRAEFRELLEKALAVNLESAPEVRVANLAAQQRARWLLGRIDDLILETEPPVPAVTVPTLEEQP